MTKLRDVSAAPAVGERPAIGETHTKRERKAAQAAAIANADRVVQHGQSNAAGVDQQAAGTSATDKEG